MRDRLSTYFSYIWNIDSGVREEEKDNRINYLINFAIIVLGISLDIVCLIWNNTANSNTLTGLFQGVFLIYLLILICGSAFVFLFFLKFLTKGVKDAIIFAIRIVLVAIAGGVLFITIIIPFRRDMELKKALNIIATGEKLSSDVYVNTKNHLYVIELPEGIMNIPSDIQYFHSKDPLAKGKLVIPNSVNDISGSDLQFVRDYECIELPDNFNYIQTTNGMYIDNPNFENITSIIWRGKTYTDASILQGDLLYNGIYCPHNFFNNSRMKNKSNLIKIPLRMDLAEYDSNFYGAYYYPHIYENVIFDENSFKNGECIVSLGLPSNFSFVANPHFDMKIFPNLKEIVYEDMHYQIHNREEYYALLQVLRNNSIDVPDDFILGLEFQ